MSAALVGTAVAAAAILREDGARRTQAPAKPLASGRTLTLGTPAGDVAVFVTAQPGGPVNVVAVPGEGSLPRNAVSVSADRSPVDLTACGRDCFQFDKPVLAGRATRVAIAVARTGNATQRAVVDLPARLPPSGDAALRRAKRVMKGLRAVRYRETLTSGRPGQTIIGDFQAQAPNRLRIDSNSNEHIVLIGNTRWVKTNGVWARSQALGTRQPAYPWDEARDARVLGRPKIDGGRGWLLGVRYPGAEPLWFRLLVLPNGRVRTMVMVARAHFMTQSYTGYNSRLSIEAPAATNP
jgi:hypothetical protein